MKHKSHADVDRRLAKIVGHIEGIRKMIHDEKPCAQLLQQIKAVISALESVREIMVKDHVRHCLADAIHSRSAESAIEEIESIINNLF